MHAETYARPELETELTGGGSSCEAAARMLERASSPEHKRSLEHTHASLVLVDSNIQQQ